MLPEQEEKIRKIFTDSKSFSVVADKDAGEETLLAKEALALAIKNSGGLVCQFPDRTKYFNQKWSLILSPAGDFPFVYSTSILIPKGKVDAKEISYSEDDDYISINVTSSKETVSKENTVFKLMPSEVDAVFYFDENGKNTIGQNTANEISNKIKILNEQNLAIITRSGEKETFAEKVFDIIRTAQLDVDIGNTSAPSLILASLVVETSFFKLPLSQRAAELPPSLIKLGANKEKIDAILNRKETSFIKLLGRALARSAPNESLKSLWAFISQEDLEKTVHSGADENLFYELMLKLKELSMADSHKALVLVWQKKEGVLAGVMPRANDLKTVESLISSLVARRKSGYLLCGPYKNFSEAEIKIQSALKEIV